MYKLYWLIYFSLKKGIQGISTLTLKMRNLLLNTQLQLYELTFKMRQACSTGNIDYTSRLAHVTHVSINGFYHVHQTCCKWSMSTTNYWFGFRIGSISLACTVILVHPFRISTACQLIHINTVRMKPVGMHQNYFSRSTPTYFLRQPQYKTMM